MANGAGSDRQDGPGGPGSTPGAPRRSGDGAQEAKLRRQLAALLRYGAPPGPPAGLPAGSLAAASLPPPLDPGPTGATGVDGAGREWEGLDWPSLHRLASAERLDALLYVALLGAGRLQAPPPAVCAGLEAAYWRTKVANLLALDAVDQLAGALAAVDVPVVVLKGAALAFTLYPDPARRPLGDIDLLVPVDQVAIALRVLGLLGYAPAQGSLAENIAGRVAAGDTRILQRRCEVTLLRDDRLRTQVDLHWGLNGRALLRRGMDVAWFWDHTHLATLGRREVRVLCEEAQFLHLCAHTLQHGVPRLRWTYDMALMLARRSLVWEVVLAGAERCGLTLAVQSSLAAVALIWGVAAPASVQERLASLPVAGAELRLRRVTWSGDRRAVAACDLLSQPDLGSALDVWLAAALPPAAYLRQRYKVADIHLLPAYYLLHAVRGTVLGGLGVLRVLRARGDHRACGDPPAHGDWSAAPAPGGDA